MFNSLRGVWLTCLSRPLAPKAIVCGRNYNHLHITQIHYVVVCCRLSPLLLSISTASLHMARILLCSFCLEEFLCKASCQPLCSFSNFTLMAIPIHPFRHSIISPQWWGHLKDAVVDKQRQSTREWDWLSI